MLTSIAFTVSMILLGQTLSSIFRGSNAQKVKLEGVIRLKGHHYLGFDVYEITDATGHKTTVEIASSKIGGIGNNQHVTLEGTVANRFGKEDYRISSVKLTPQVALKAA